MSQNWTIMIVIAVVLLLAVCLSFLSPLRRLRIFRSGGVRRSDDDYEWSDSTDESVEETGSNESRLLEAVQAALADARRGAQDAASAAARQGVDAALIQLRGELGVWAETVATRAAAGSDRLASSVDALRDEISLLRGLIEARHPAPDSNAPEEAALIPFSAYRGAARPEPLGMAGPDSAPGPEPRSGEGPSALNPAAERSSPDHGLASGGIRIARLTAADVLGETVKWFALLGLTDEEASRIESEQDEQDVAEAVRKLFTSLHKVAAERRLSADQPLLNWRRVGPECLTAFVAKFHPGTNNCLIWPSVGDDFNPRTMHPLHKEESGRGGVTEIVAPGYATDAGTAIVKALIVY